MLRFGTPRISTGVPQTEPVAEFDEQLWGYMVDYVTVRVDKGMTVMFRDGTEMSVWEFGA